MIFVASYLNTRKELLAVATRRLGPIALPEPRHLAPLLVAWVLSLVVLFVEKDLGSSLLFFRIIVVMLWLATGRAAYLVLGLLLFALGAFVGWTLFDHVQDRVEIWLNALAPCPPGVDPAEVVCAQARVPGGAVAVRAGHREHRRHRPRRGAIPSSSPTPTPTSSSRPSGRAWASWGPWPS